MHSWCKSTWSSMYDLQLTSSSIFYKFCGRNLLIYKTAGRTGFIAWKCSYPLSVYDYFQYGITLKLNRWKQRVPLWKVGWMLPLDMYYMNTLHDQNQIIYFIAQENSMIQNRIMQRTSHTCLGQLSCKLFWALHV